MKGIGVAAALAWSALGFAQTPLLVHDVNPGAVSNHRPSSAVERAGVAYFSMSTEATGRELWRTDGSAAGTWLVKDIWPGRCDSITGVPVLVG